MSNAARAVTRPVRTAGKRGIGSVPRKPGRTVYKAPAGPRLPQWTFTVVRREPKTSHGRVSPMGSARRLASYRAQNGGSPLAPGQYRRWQHKHNATRGAE
jgi:hypothetical protein